MYPCTEPSTRVPRLKILDGAAVRGYGDGVPRVAGVYHRQAAAGVDALQGEGFVHDDVFIVGPAVNLDSVAGAGIIDRRLDAGVVAARGADCEDFRNAGA